MSDSTRKKPKPRILALTERLDVAGGLERALADKSKIWCDLGYEVHVGTVGQTGKDYFVLDERIARSDLAIHYRRNLSLFAPVNIFRSVLHFVRLRKLIKKVKPSHIIICIYGYDFYFLRLIARGIYCINENHSSRVASGKPRRGLLGSIKFRIRHYTDGLYNAQVFLSTEEAAFSGLSNTWVIPNFVVVKEQVGATKRKQVISAGRICHIKGFDRLVEAWSLASPTIPDWELRIYGDGTEEDVQELQDQIRSEGLCNTVKLLPATKSICARMAESRIYAMTSRSECFPMVLLEAMSLGLPIVAFDCPTGPRNIIENGVSGILVEDGDIKAFADALVRLAQNEDYAKALEDGARNHSARYSPVSVAAKWETLINDASRT